MSSMKPTPIDPNDSDSTLAATAGEWSLKRQRRADSAEPTGTLGLLAAWLRTVMPPVPLFLFIQVVGAICMAVISFTIWNLTLTPIKANSVAFAQGAQRAILSKAVLELQKRIDTAERLVRYQRSQWDKGIYGEDTPEQKAYTFRQLLSTLNMYQDWVASNYYTTKGGGINGYYTWQNANTGAFEYEVWYTNSTGYYYAGPVNPETGALLSIDRTQFGYNVSDEIWVTIALPPRPKAPPAWTKTYGYGKTLWMSLSQAVFDQAGEFVAVASADFDLGFIANIMGKLIAENQKQLSTPTENVTMYLFEAATDTIVGSLLPTSSVTTLDVDGAFRTLSITEMSAIDPRLTLITDYVRSQQMRLSAMKHHSFRIPGYFVEIATVSSAVFPASNLKWTLIQIGPEGIVTTPLQAANQTTAIAAGSMVALTLFIGLGCSALVTGHLRSVCEDLKLLGQLDIAAVVDRHSRPVKMARITKELWNLQFAVARLVKSFTEATDSAEQTVGSVTSSDELLS
ncbi:hypothetical protein BCR44DRAFT_282987 [Catenaria anguillulae PL171]|uniref:Cache domain-containing protein n=1 Tax=Catenaria anguillulae PL171 TaxID=765915 RepID=A0A1Y2HDC5_9FUNG|nr:hypothetical protein BCR44DRAFT_282987 [Catenaria anguillulae PL171]